MTGYTTREVSEVLDLPAWKVRALARSGILDPHRGPGNQYRFTFQDIILLRAARGLEEEGVRPRRIRAALSGLREQLPSGRPLSAVVVTAQGDEVVVRDRGTSWEPTTGQVTFDFDVGALAARVEPFAPRAARERADAGEMVADDWYDLGLDLEAVSIDEAATAYREALALDPGHAEAHLNLGRLEHEKGRIEEAERHYRSSVDAAPESGLGWFNLGVALEDLDRAERAKELYRRALDLDPSLAPAHFNLARLHERDGEVSDAVRHLASYRRLRRASGS